jgi:sulfur-oxidizing protein SoxZ
MARTLITVPKSAKIGEIIEIKALAQHAMETGYRRSSEGDMLPRDLIRNFSCHFVAAAGVNGARELVFAAIFHAAIAANPYLAFHFRATTNGRLFFKWEGDKGYVETETATLLVT